MVLDIDKIDAVYMSVLRRMPTEAERIANAQAKDVPTLAGILLADSEAQTFVMPMIRMYQAAFGRVAEVEGLDFWVNELRNGRSLQDIAVFFLRSPEAINREISYQVAADTYISALYKNVLERQPDSGQHFWIDLVTPDINSPCLYIAQFCRVRGVLNKHDGFDYPSSHRCCRRESGSGKTLATRSIVASNIIHTGQ